MGVPSVGVVITAFNQGEMVTEAVASVLVQTQRVDEIVVVDDGSTDPKSLAALARLDHTPIRVHRQANAGVSAARNAGIGLLSSEYVAVLDGDDAWDPTFVEATTALLDASPQTVAASSWLEMFGVANGVVQPTGGTLVDFLPRNASPASAVFRRADWTRSGGYDESMTEGFEDWDFFLRLLRRAGTPAITTEGTRDDAPSGTPGTSPANAREATRVGIVPAPLLRYRTHPSSFNIRSMENRLARYRQIIDNHHDAFAAHLTDALLGLEATSMARLAAWEHLHVEDPTLPVAAATFGDGGMAAAVRIATHRA